MIRAILSHKNVIQHKRTGKMSNNNNTTTGVHTSNLILINTGASGFSNYDSLSEFADNSIDVRANHIKVRFGDASDTIYFTDNGLGMERELLPEYYTLYRHVARGDSQTNGVFGIGSKAGLIKLSMAKRPTTTYTKTMEAWSELTEMKLDWAKAVATGVYERSPHDITKKGEEIWDKYGPGSNGTLLQIQCDNEVYNELKSNIPKICDDFGRKYYRSIDTGLRITIIDGRGNEIEVESNNPIGTVTESGESKIETYKVKEDGSFRYYYKNGNMHTVYIRDDDVKKTQSFETKHDPSIEPKLYERMEGCEISIRSGYRKDFGEENSGYHYMRGNKIIDRFAKQFPGTGDFGLRDVIGHSRHVIQFDKRMDVLMKIELNKSRIKEADLPGTLRKSIDTITTKFATSLYKKSYKKKKLKLKETTIQNLSLAPVAAPPVITQLAPASAAVPHHIAIPVLDVVVPPPLTRQVVIPATPVITRTTPVVVTPPLEQAATRARPPVHYEIQFDISSSKELIITDTMTETRIITLPTDGNGADLRGVLIGRLLKLADREKFIKECLPLMEQLMNIYTPLKN